VDAYSLVLASLLLPAGLLGDRYGRKKLLLGALALFGAASIACAYAPSAGVGIGARAVLGLGAAFVMPLSLEDAPPVLGYASARRPDSHRDLPPGWVERPHAAPQAINRSQHDNYP
jgi:predicted MFS family arabinose efflux permease